MPDPTDLDADPPLDDGGRPRRRPEHDAPADAPARRFGSIPAAGPRLAEVGETLASRADTLVRALLALEETLVQWAAACFRGRDDDGARALARGVMLVEHRAYVVLRPLVAALESAFDRTAAALTVPSEEQRQPRAEPPRAIEPATAVAGEGSPSPGIARKTVAGPRASSRETIVTPAAGKKVAARKKAVAKKKTAKKKTASKKKTATKKKAAAKKKPVARKKAVTRKKAAPKDDAVAESEPASTREPPGPAGGPEGPMR